MSKEKLKVVKPEETKKSLKDIPVRSFYNTCPLKLDQLPCKGCKLGKKSIEEPDEEKQSCKWAINSEKHHYCFWKFIHDNSLPNGRSVELLQSEIAELMKLSSTKIHFTLKEAIEKLKKSEHLQILLDYYGGVPENGDEAEVGGLVGFDGGEDDGE